MRLSKKIRNFAKKKFGVEYRVGPTCKSVGISGAELPEKFEAAYCGRGVVFVRWPTNVPTQEDFNVVLLHELGHAVLDFFKMKIPEKQEEIKANALALGFAALLRIPVSRKMIKNFERYAKVKALTVYAK